MQPSTSSTYSSSLLKLEKALDIAPKESMKQLLAIDTTSLEGVDRLSLKEKHDREAIEIELLNQSVEYYKRLNALTVPILMKSRNSQGAMHLKKEEWDIIMQNTDACFNDFTLRLKNTYPQLTLEEVRFACLLKMELSLSLLSEVYHIAKGSISRKKMRLKEKMQIENTTLDDFIKQF